MDRAYAGNIWEETLPEILDAYASQIIGRENEELTVWLPVPEILFTEESKTEFIDKIYDFKSNPFVQYSALLPITGILDGNGNRMEFQDCLFAFFAFYPYNVVPWPDATKIIEKYRTEPTLRKTLGD